MVSREPAPQFLEVCTYCGSEEAERGLWRQAIFGGDWYGDTSLRWLVRAAVPACRVCARDVREVQRRLRIAWRLTPGDAAHRSDGDGAATELESADSMPLAADQARSAGGDPSDVDALTRQLARALFRLETHSPLPADARIVSAQLSATDPFELARLVNAQGLQRSELAPAISYWFVREADSLWGSICYVSIAGRIFLFARSSSDAE